MAGMVLGVKQIIVAACNFSSLAASELAAPGSAMDLECCGQNNESRREVAAFCVVSF